MFSKKARQWHHLRKASQGQKLGAVRLHRAPYFVTLLSDLLSCGRCDRCGSRVMLQIHKAFNEEKMCKLGLQRESMELASHVEDRSLRDRGEVERYTFKN